MKIIVDAFGGDNAPVEIIKGCNLALQELLDLKITLVGNTEKIKEVCAEQNININQFELVNANSVIEMCDPPTDIMKAKKDSSMAVALKELADGNGDAVVSAGSTGSLVVGASTIVRRLKGIKRAGLAPIMPSNSGMFMLMDCGANVDCKPEFLQQFAIMGSIYMNKVMGINNPRVGLLNNGSESSKGTELQLLTHSLLKETKNINFVGNVEGNDVPVGKCDVCVTDGFTGNIFLKTFEGVASVLMSNIKGIFTKNIFTKLAAAMVLKHMKTFKKKMDANEYGGAPLLGLAKPVFKSHGSSNANTFKNAIKNTYKFVQGDVIGEIAKSLESMKQE